MADSDDKSPIYWTRARADILKRMMAILGELDDDGLAQAATELIGGKFRPAQQPGQFTHEVDATYGGVFDQALAPKYDAERS